MKPSPMDEIKDGVLFLFNFLFFLQATLDSLSLSSPMCLVDLSVKEEWVRKVLNFSNSLNQFSIKNTYTWKTEHLSEFGWLLNNNLQNIAFKRNPLSESH